MVEGETSLMCDREDKLMKLAKTSTKLWIRLFVAKLLILIDERRF